MTPHQVMRSILGTDEYAGGADNPTILAWRDEIGRRFPEMASYCANYTHDSIPWCGLTVAYCMAAAGIRPVFGARDVDRFLWAAAWDEFGFDVELDNLQPGDVLVFDHHVALFDRWADSSRQVIVVVGGNQSDSVTEARYRRGAILAARRAPAAHPVLAPSTRRFTQITATVFGGPQDAMAGGTPAYGATGAWWERNGVALPDRFQGPRPKVRVFHGDRSVVCEILDVGPHNIDDPYWATGTRPKAERGIREPGLGGAPKNKAGIDLTPAAARAIGLSGKGLVDWEFVDELAPGLPAPPTTTPQPIELDVEKLLLLALVAIVLWPQLEKFMSELNRESGMPSLAPAAAPAPAAPAATAEPSILSQLLPLALPLLKQLLFKDTSPPAAPPPAAPAAPATNTTGVGIGITGVMGVVIAVIAGWIGIPLPASLVGDSASSIASLLLTIFGGTAALGQTGTISWIIDLGRRILGKKEA